MVFNKITIDDKEELVCNYPMVSVITPVLNGVKYLESCIDSVLNQSYYNVEHIFVDGGSDDGTLNIIKNYMSKFPYRIRLLSEPDKGVGDALNKGIKMANGEIIGWLDSDSHFERNTINIVANYFKNNPGAYVVFGECCLVNENNEIMGKYPIKDFDLKEAITNRCCIPFQSTFYKKKLFERVGLFNDLGNCQEFWIRTGKCFTFYRIQSVLSNNRLDEEGIFFSKDVDKRKVLKNRLREDCNMCIQHGGSFLAPRVRRYYIFMLFDKLGLYSIIASVILKNRYRYCLIDKILRALKI